MILDRFQEIQKLSPAEKLMVVSELWNDLEENPVEIPVSEEVIAELNRRMQYFQQHHEEFTTWESVKARIAAPRKVTFAHEVLSMSEHRFESTKFDNVKKQRELLRAASPPVGIKKFKRPEIMARLREKFGKRTFDSNDLAKGLAESRQEW